MSHPLKPLRCLACNGKLQQPKSRGRPRKFCSVKCWASHEAAQKRAGRKSDAAEYSARCGSCGESLAVPHRRLCPTLEVRP